MADLTVLLTPRAPGGHEKALLNWLRDAVESEGLRPAIIGTDAAMAAACEQAGLQRHLVRARCEAHLEMTPAARMRLALRRAPRGRPLLLAPGALHAQAWLTAAAIRHRHEVWSYVPVTGTAREMGYPYAPLRDALLAPWVRRVAGWITIDDTQRSRLQSRWGVQRPVHVLPNNIPLPAPAPPPQRAADAPLSVAFVGRFDAWTKGLDWLAAELTADAEWSASCRWHFQGAGPDEALLMELASTLGPQRVQVHRFAPIEDALARADVLLLPSRYEGVPLVALEASARGWPVVASHGTGLKSLLPANSLFEFGDSAGLARALDSVRTPAARQEAVAHARERLPRLMQPERYAMTLRTLVQTWRDRPGSA